MIVPRGGKSLVARVQDEARVPVFAHLEGLCHTYVHKAADPQKALDIVVNAKMRRTSVCGRDGDIADRPHRRARIAAEDRRRPYRPRLRIARRFRKRATSRPMKEATEEDWRTEYLAPIIAVRVVDGVDEAMAHIAQYGSSHTDCIVTEHTGAAERFLEEVDSAIVLHNASTQFADGGEFGFGGEIGIATGRMHARGPVGAEQLTTFKYRVHGDGQIRP